MYTKQDKENLNKNYMKEKRTHVIYTDVCRVSLTFKMVKLWHYRPGKALRAPAG
jgi:hypothetical protein